MVRREDEEKFQLAPAVVCHNVEIKDANTVENGYGCRLVAVCDSVDFPEEDVKLTFPVTFGGAFIACENTLSGMEVMSLGRDGSISADGIVIAKKGQFDFYLDIGVKVQNSNSSY